MGVVRMIIALCIFCVILFFIDYGQKAKIIELQKTIKELMEYENETRTKINKIYELMIDNNES